MANLSAVTIANGKIGTATDSDTLRGSLGYGGAQSLTAAQIAQALANLGLAAPPNRNPVDNAEMRVAQRGASFTNVGSGGPPGLTLDRWCGVRGTYAAGLSVSQVAGPAGYAYAARVQRASGDTSTQFIQFFEVLESIEVARFAGQTVTMSFTLRAGANFSPTGGAVTAVLWFGTGTDEGRAKFASGWTGASNSGSAGAVTASATATRFSFSAPIPVGAAEIAVGFTWTPTGTAGAADTLDITGVQLDPGTAAGPFEREPISVTFARCQRHYRTGSVRYDGYFGLTSATFSAPEDFQVVMRAAPTLTQTSTAATNCGTTTGSVNVTTQGFNDTRTTTATGAGSWTTTYTASADL